MSERLTGRRGPHAAALRCLGRYIKFCLRFAFVGMELQALEREHKSDAAVPAECTF
jgi:hypothetical protein